MRGTARASVDLFRFVEGLASQHLDTIVCLTEFIDNALDAQATLVRIIAKNKELRICDNGNGVPDPSKLVCFGGHVSHKGTRSGMYGAGFKDACLCQGGVQSKVGITTRCEGKRTACTIDWQRLRDSDECMDWDSEADPEGTPGTDITIRPLRRAFPTGDRLDRMLTMLGYIYSPAIKQQRVIQVTAGGKTYTVSRWQLPKLVDVVDERIEIGGKRARLYAGIVAEGEKNDFPGLTYSHGFRVVKKASRAGCGAWGHSRICGFVEIDEKSGWSRTKNKTDLINADDLYEEVERRLTPLFQKCATQAHSIEIEGLREELGAMLTAAIVGPPTEKARRDKGDQTGSKEPTGRGGKHRRARETQPGATFGSRKVIGIRAEYRDGWSEGEPIGEWDANNKVGCVTLFKDHPAIKRALATQNNEALFFVAMSVIAASHNSASSAQGSLVSSHDILSKLAEFTSKSATVDGQVVGVAPIVVDEAAE